jgi:hypothetical protein
MMRIEPGRYTNVLARRAKNDGVLAKYEAKNIRLIADLAAREAPGTVVITWRTDDWEKYGKVSQALFSGDGTADHSGREQALIA